MKIWPDAKINLGLNVLRKREDGYHDLETLFVPCRTFRDELEVEESDRFSIEINPCSWDPDDDLTVRAYRMLQDEFGLPPVSIRLEKNIPVGAGLGGGSSDAAFMLKALNLMFGLGLCEDELARRASSLGSDCAFFIYDRPMMGQGRGEILTPFDLDLSNYEMKVEIPSGVAVSTAEAYSGVRMHSGIPLREALALPVCEWRRVLANSFEPTVFAIHPEIAALKQRFYDEGAVYASMSGSGSSVFAFFDKLDKFEE